MSTYTCFHFVASPNRGKVRNLNPASLLLFFTIWLEFLIRKIIFLQIYFLYFCFKETPKLNDSYQEPYWASNSKSLPFRIKSRPESIFRHGPMPKHCAPFLLPLLKSTFFLWKQKIIKRTRKIKAKMATLARLSRRILPRTRFSPLSGRALSAEAGAAKSTQPPAPPAPTVRESADRVKWDYRGQRKIIPLGQWAPKIAVDAYVAPNVVLAGQVAVYDGASVWNGAVLRGDLNKITVGFCSNVQERCVIHAAWSSPTGQFFDCFCCTMIFNASRWSLLSVFFSGFWLGLWYLKQIESAWVEVVIIVLFELELWLFSVFYCLSRCNKRSKMIQVSWVLHFITWVVPKTHFQ